MIRCTSDLHMKSTAVATLKDDFMRLLGSKKADSVGYTVNNENSVRKRK